MKSVKIGLIGACGLFLGGPCEAQQRFERVTVSTAGTEASGNLASNRVIVSADGRHFAFDDFGSNLAPWDINGAADVFVRDRVAGTTTMVSVALTGLSANNGSFVGGMSRDGRFITFYSYAYDLVKFDTNSVADVFLRDRDPDVNGVFDEGNETTVRVSLDSNGGEANNSSYAGAVSLDGTKVAFWSSATNLVTGDTNATDDIFVRDLVAGTTTRVSVSSSGTQANGYSQLPAISDDGTIVMFVSYANNLIGNDRNSRQDVFVRDLVAGTTGRVSVGSGGVEGNGDTYEFAMAADGQRVAFRTWSDNLVSGDSNGYYDVFLRDRVNKTTTLVSVSETGVQSQYGAHSPQISPDGGFVLFTSPGTDLAGIETNQSEDVFVRDVAAGTLRKVSVHLSGAEGASGSYGHAISDGGSWVALLNYGNDLSGPDTNGIPDVLVRDRTLPDPEASWQNYGAGWPGTLGIPSLTAASDPVLGRTLDVAIGNSLGFYTVGFLYAGLQQISLPTGFGGTLLVAPIYSTVFLVDLAGATISEDLPLDDTLAGISLYAQVLELDGGASKGVSFTPGLELILGQ